MGYTGVPTVTVAPPTALAALAFFGLTTSTPGGVQLPQDTVAVAVAGNLPAGSIEAKAVPSLAAASFAGVPTATACPTDGPLVSLSAGTCLTQANDTFQVFIGAGSRRPVPGHRAGLSFDPRPMLFADQANGNASCHGHRYARADRLVVVVVGPEPGKYGRFPRRRWLAHDGAADHHGNHLGRITRRSGPECAPGSDRQRRPSPASLATSMSRVVASPARSRPPQTSVARSRIRRAASPESRPFRPAAASPARSSSAAT